ncbi:MAG: response regulator [Candidatus Pacebacteria bacterium]|nr:response regulator [Candidatus Paceibacterota bacterium]
MPIKILLIDDSDEMLESTKELFKTKGYICSIINRFDDGLKELTKDNFNIIITDYKDSKGDSDAGKKVINKLQSIYFSPLIIYTGFIGSIDDEIIKKQNSFFRIVEKGVDSDKELLKTVDDILKSKEYKVKKGIEEEIEITLKNNFREYFWDIVHNYWSDFEKINEETLRNVLLRKILNNIHQKYLTGKEINPIEFYEHLAIDHSEIQTGVIIKKDGNFYICVSNDCDLCRCNLNALIFLKIKNYDEILISLTENSKPEKVKHIKSRFLNNNHNDYREKSFIFPKTFFFLGGIAYFDEIISLFEVKECEIIISDDIEFIAKVNQPFLSSLISNFSKFYNRIGTPDIDVS